jgi:hypothetical protein
MTKREKIIVGIMCLAVLYGAYDLFVYRKKPKYTATQPSANPITELKSFVAEVTQKLINEKVSAEYSYMISQAGANWTKDPFIASVEPLKKRQTIEEAPQKEIVPPTRSGFIYTGYLELGPTKLAVINGLEYSVGESLDTNGLYVKSISPHHVVIGKVNGLETLQLPLRELDPGLGKKTR